MWVTDRCVFVHERQRVQITLFLLVHAYCGARAGTFIEQSSERGSNRCLTYKVRAMREVNCSANMHLKDVGLHVYVDDQDNKSYVMEVTERFTKANQDVDTNTFVRPSL